MTMTKNVQTQENIARLAKHAFAEKDMLSCLELTEGKCNAAYLVQFSNGSKSVLKVASDNRAAFLTNEVDLMDTEVEAMRLLQQSNLIKVANIECYDPSKTLCSGSYFFMEVLEGESYQSMLENLTDIEKAEINYEIGQIQRKLDRIHGQEFGMLGKKEKRYGSMFEFIYRLIANVLHDAEKKDVYIGVESNVILSRLEGHQKVFEEVTQPSLVHWDLWEGNIIIKDKKINGIIDWERAMWSEPLMCDRFRMHARKEEFLKGYGKTTFTENETCRMYWYDMYLYLSLMTEVSYREYETDEQYRWVKPFFDEVWKRLQQVK